MEEVDCCICREHPAVNAVALDCSHVFCYLCIKSAFELDGRCPMCRAEIGIEFNFKEHDLLGAIKLPQSNDGYYWFYEGYRGWWLYDPDTNRKLSDAYTNNRSKVEVFLSGCVYILDLHSKTQYRQDGSGRVRKICRATLDLNDIIGMNGLKGPDIDEMIDDLRSGVLDVFSRRSDH